MKTKIKTFEAACKALNLNPKTLPQVSMLPEKHQKALQAHYKLIIIAEALNEGWTPDWTDHSQWKYYPWFYMEKDESKPSGVGFSCYDCDFWAAHTGVGSRLCFKSSELAEFAGSTFADLYRDYMLIE